jgi:hypothetical protein
MFILNVCHMSKMLCKAKRMTKDYNPFWIMFETSFSEIQSPYSSVLNSCHSSQCMFRNKIDLNFNYALLLATIIWEFSKLLSEHWNKWKAVITFLLFKWNQWNLVQNKHQSWKWTYLCFKLIFGIKFLS